MPVENMCEILISGFRVPRLYMSKMTCEEWVLGVFYEGTFYDS